MAISSWFKNFFGIKDTDANDAAAFYATIYPESVRYALSHNEAYLGPAEFHALVHNFPYEVVYLMVKAVAYTPQKQRQYIEDLTRIYMQDDYMEDLKAFLHKEIDLLPSGSRVQGTKLAQLSRYGAAYWQDKFRILIENAIKEDSLAVPRIVAHTPFIAYHHFIDLYKNKGNGQLSVIVPEWMIDKDNNLMGYSIDLHDGVHVLIQEKSRCLHGNWDCMGHACNLDERLCQRSYFIDDTINTGTTSKKVTNFWNSKYGSEVPLDRIKVITNLSDKANKPSKEDD